MDQGPVTQSVHLPRRILPEKIGIRQTGHHDFDGVMDGRHQFPSRLCERELKNGADAALEKEAEQQEKVTDMAPVQLSSAVPLEFQLAARHGALLTWMESSSQGTAQAADRHLPQRLGFRQHGNVGQIANDERQVAPPRQAAHAARELGDLNLRLLGQLTGPPQLQETVTLSTIRAAADLERSKSEVPAESLRMTRDDNIEKPERPLRAQTERDSGNSQDAPHDQPDRQQVAPATSSIASTGQTPATAGAFATPAEQIGQRLSQALAGMDSNSKGPLTGATIKSLNIILEPEQLGTVHVSLTLRSDGMHVRIAAAETTTADVLHRDRYQLDGLLRPIGVDGWAAPVTITIEPLREAPGTASGPSTEQPTSYGSADQDFRHNGSGQDRHPRADRQARENGSSSPASGQEDASPARHDRPGTMVV